MSLENDCIPKDSILFVIVHPECNQINHLNYSAIRGEILQ